MKVIFITTIILIVGCSALEGKIEKRKNGDYYLVNTSKTKGFDFTIKTTKIVDDSIYQYSTQIITLHPGDEISLDENTFDTSTFIRYPIFDTPILHLYNASELKEKIKDPDPFLLGTDEKKYNELHKLRDTIINGKRLKYEYIIESIEDTLHPYPIPKISYKYEVTGQSENFKLKK